MKIDTTTVSKQALQPNQTGGLGIFQAIPFLLHKTHERSQNELNILVNLMIRKTFVGKL